MKLAHTVLLGTITCVAACSHAQEPRTAQAVPPTPPRQAPITVAGADEPQLAPGAPTIPSGPKVAPPIAPAAEPADETPVTSSSSLASPRPGSSPAVPVDPALDRAETSSDAESVREIRALLAADKSLSATARKVMITANNGRVRLTGPVNTAEERATIERAARKAANVVDVKNQLVVLE